MRDASIHIGTLGGGIAEVEAWASESDKKTKAANVLTCSHQRHIQVQQRRPAASPSQSVHKTSTRLAGLSHHCTRKLRKCVRMFTRVPFNVSKILSTCFSELDRSWLEAGTLTRHYFLGDAENVAHRIPSTNRDLATRPSACSSNFRRLFVRTTAHSLPETTKFSDSASPLKCPKICR